MIPAALALTLAASTDVRAQGTNAERARQLFTDARTQFDLGHFDQAIRGFEEAYRLRTDPVFLFNIAQAHRLSGNPDRALFFYRSYLRNRPDAPNRADAELRIAQCQQTIEQRNGRHDRDAPVMPLGATREPQTSARTTIAVEVPAPQISSGQARGTVWEAELAGGAGSWVAGAPDDGAPGVLASFAFGAIPSWARGDRFALRLAARASVWSAADSSRRTTMVPLLLEPALQVSLTSTWSLALACGMGVAVFPSLDARSDLLREEAARVTGALRALEVRPSASLRWEASRTTAVALTAAYAWDGGLDAYFRARSLQRVEASLGVVQRW